MLITPLTPLRFDPRALRLNRRARLWSQSDLRRLLYAHGLTVSMSTISTWERSCVPNANAFLALSTIFRNSDCLVSWPYGYVCLATQAQSILLYRGNVHYVFHPAHPSPIQISDSVALTLALHPDALDQFASKTAQWYRSTIPPDKR